MKRPLWTYWRWWLWCYRSAAGGWYVVVQGRGHHIKRGPLAWLRRRIVIAAPTCTLWEKSAVHDCLRFRLWPQWSITSVEYMDVACSYTRYPLKAKA